MEYMFAFCFLLCYNHFINYESQIFFSIFIYFDIIFYGKSYVTYNQFLKPIKRYSYGGHDMGYGKITAKQQEILDYIKDEILKKGYPPTVREICETVNLKSTSSVHSHLETLEKNGYIRRDPTKPRAIEICDDSFQMVRTEMVSLPIIGNVAAGQPILAEENIEDYFPVPADVVPQGESFILNVRGESMINAGIFNGDRVFVHVQNTAHNGEIVVALIDDSATVKTFYKEKGHIRLQPENDTMDPIIVDDCQILGTVFGVFRFYR